MLMEGADVAGDIFYDRMSMEECGRCGAGYDQCTVRAAGRPCRRGDGLPGSIHRSVRARPSPRRSKPTKRCAGLLAGLTAARASLVLRTDPSFVAQASKLCFPAG